MLKETSKIRRFITKCMNSDDGWYCWYNNIGLITKKGLEELTAYVEQHRQIKELVVVNNIEMTRPQRTWGSLPTWFRPCSAMHSFDNSAYNNSFIFTVWKNEDSFDYTPDEMKDLIESLPTKSQIIIIKGEGNDR